MSSESAAKLQKKPFEEMPSGVGSDDRKPYFKPSDLKKNENARTSLLHLPLNNVPLILEPSENINGASSTHE